MSKFWTDKGYKDNVILYLSSSVPHGDKLRFLEDYAEWLEKQIMDDVPDCDSCERIHPDNIGDYVAEHMESRYDR